MLHLRGGRNAHLARRSIPDLDEFWADVAARLPRRRSRTSRKPAAPTCSSTTSSFAYLCDPKIRENCRKNGDDPATLPRTYADAINAALRDRPAGMTVTMHTCRGNFKSAWVAEGGYDPVAEAMFSADVDGFFMEFDSERAGQLRAAALRCRRARRWCSASSPPRSASSRTRTMLKRRIDEAAKFVPLENLCLSPQCGFSSTHHGNALSAGRAVAQARAGRRGRARGLGLSASADRNSTACC